MKDFMIAGGGGRRFHIPLETSALNELSTLVDPLADCWKS
jgi:hypothetical protein